MATLMIRNVDAVVKERLRIRAARHGRSMEAELQFILGNALADGGSASPTWPKPSASALRLSAGLIWSLTRRCRSAHHRALNRDRA